LQSRHGRVNRSPNVCTWREGRFAWTRRPSWLDKLNPQQRAAATAARDVPLLIIAGAGTGKTNTLAHRVAHLIATGTDPARILLLTFTRPPPAAEMLKRVEGLVPASPSLSRVWGGTFHSIGNRSAAHPRSLGWPGRVVHGHRSQRCAKTCSTACAASWVSTRVKSGSPRRAPAWPFTAAA
jgi:hypothetical protein